MSCFTCKMMRLRMHVAASKLIGKTMDEIHESVKSMVGSRYIVLMRVSGGIRYLMVATPQGVITLAKERA